MYFKPLLAPTLWYLPGMALLLVLGFWQLERLQEKETLIARVETAMKAPAQDLRTVLAMGENAEWHHVRLEGRFLHAREIYLFGRGPGGSAGYHVLTPFALNDGATILVDRGYVPDDKRAPAARAEAQLDGPQTITGVLRTAQAPGMFTPAPDMRSKLWFSKDIAAMAKIIGTPLIADVLVEADAAPVPGGWPLGGQTVVDFPNNHLQYALTWFGLALALTGVYLFYHHTRGRLGAGRGKRKAS